MKCSKKVKKSIYSKFTQDLEVHNIVNYYYKLSEFFNCKIFGKSKGGCQEDKPI